MLDELPSTRVYLWDYLVSIY